MKGFELATSKKQSPLIEIGDESLHWTSKYHHPLLTNGEEEGGGGRQPIKGEADEGGKTRWFRFKFEFLHE